MRATGRDTTIGALVDSLGSQAFGVTMFVFAVPNLVPNPPGTSPVLGAPLGFLSLQLALGRRASDVLEEADRAAGVEYRLGTDTATGHSSSVRSTVIVLVLNPANGEAASST